MFGETLLLALRSIRRNVLRSSLTILGIVIGIAAVITLVTLGGGATVQVANQIKSLAAISSACAGGSRALAACGRPRGCSGEGPRAIGARHLRDRGRGADGVPKHARHQRRHELVDGRHRRVARLSARARWPLARGRVFTDELRAGR
jgi:putative ABC transport system permease protein